ncbi:MAG: DUF4870 domain-containing protein [Candidatus Omnitrophica bacterium]|nr:DUF4870 domain-containing protein [Candidatus Omnitrophota bacterium]
MEKTSTGLQENVACLLCYLAGWVTGLIFFLIEKDNKTVRFNAMQSIITFGGLNVIVFVLGFIPIIGWVLIPIVGILSFVLWLVLMIQSFQGKTVRLPIAADIADKHI